MLKILNDTELAFEDKVEQFVEEYITTMLKNPFMPLFIINELNALGSTFVEKMLGGVKPTIDVFVKQIEDEMEKGNIVKMNPHQIPLSMMALCAFPILAKPMVMLITGNNDKEYLELIEERKKEVVRLVLKGLKP